MDYIMAELFGYCTDPLELAARFCFVILLMDGIFGLVPALLRSLRRG